MNQTPRVVICGTGTDVGKSYVACALSAAVRSAGEKVLALKPVESGYADPAQSDAAALARAAGHNLVAPRFALSEPVSPHLAAEQENVRVESSAASEWVSQTEREFGAQRLVVIESAGGLFSPLSLTENNLTLTRALKPWRWLLVAPNRLGVLHDVLVVLAACQELQNRLPVEPHWAQPAAVVLSATEEPDASAGSNARELRRLSELAVFELERGGTALTLWSWIQELDS